MEKSIDAQRTGIDKSDAQKAIAWQIHHLIEVNKMADQLPPKELIKKAGLNAYQLYEKLMEIIILEFSDQEFEIDFNASNIFWLDNETVLEKVKPELQQEFLDYFFCEGNFQGCRGSEDLKIIQEKTSDIQRISLKNNRDFQAKLMTKLIESFKKENFSIATEILINEPDIINLSLWKHQESLIKLLQDLYENYRKSMINSEDSLHDPSKLNHIEFILKLISCSDTEQQKNHTTSFANQKQQRLYP